jgi:hypothetical protein
MHRLNVMGARDLEQGETLKNQVSKSETNVKRRTDDTSEQVQSMISDIHNKVETTDGTLIGKVFNVFHDLTESTLSKSLDQNHIQTCSCST